MVKLTQNHSNDNNIIKFKDNSSAIKGYDVPIFLPADPSVPSILQVKDGTRHVIFTAETHNFPTAVEPFSGATTGTGGRIRDVHATGRGAHVIAGTAGYSFGNCLIPGFVMPWECQTEIYPGQFAAPLKVLIEASNGASDYGNKFGEPVLCGFARSFGTRLPNGERREWLKPIMFSGGIGTIDAQWIAKIQPEPGMSMVKLGGPAYRIGLGGGAASSTVVQGSSEKQADFDVNAVQRGDAEMEQKLNRVIRACIESPTNPILSIHDQGAGGNANVLKELAEPAGAVIHADSFALGDPTLSIHELWVAEYQESVAFLTNNNEEFLKKLAKRERCPIDFVGEITNTGQVVLEDFTASADDKIKPVDLPLKLVLGQVPRKKYHLERMPVDTINRSTKEQKMPDIPFREALHRILQLPAVASKRYLTNKVDRSVTGLVAQQQCVGPLHTPLADVAVIALSPFSLRGAATAIGEQPIKTMFDVKRGARMSLIEALTNLVFAKITELKDVKCSGNWMWPAKLPFEGAALHDACDALCKLMEELGVAIDGGKDSLSMAASCGNEIVKAPGTLVISAYAPCPDIRRKITPDFKVPNNKGCIFWIDLSEGHQRLQGSSYAQILNDFTFFSEVPDLQSAKDFANAFNITQKLIEGNALTAGHDISDGGLLVCLLEMAMAGNCVFDINVPGLQGSEKRPDFVFFNEEVGWILECDVSKQKIVESAFKAHNIPCHFLGYSTKKSTQFRELHGQKVYAPFVSVNGELVYGADAGGIASFRTIWEEFSFQIEKIQSNELSAQSQKDWLFHSNEPQYFASFPPHLDVCIGGIRTGRSQKVAVMREEGSNGDREMAAALHLAGFEVWDVTVQDLLQGTLQDLSRFRGLVFVGGFSYADVFGSARGWAAVLAFNTRTRAMLEAFIQRQDTFTLGVCNGCQLLALLGVVGSAKPLSNGEVWKVNCRNSPAALRHNASGRFESRFSTVKIASNTRSIMFRGMEGSQLGVWVAHGEGRFELKESIEELRENGCVALEFVDSTGTPTENYPENPNGSPHGIAGICSPDGRHLAVMPHPERSIFTWQWPYYPQFNWPGDALVSPWLQMFKNALCWAEKFH